MEILKREAGSYIIASDGENHLISIMCGTSALFEVVLKLSDQQKAEILASNKMLQDVVDKIRLNPNIG